MTREVLNATLAVLPLPKLFVFDLDYTLWPFWCDTHVCPPFHQDKNGQVVDCSGYKINLYHNVKTVLSCLSEHGILIAAASRTDEPPTAEKLLQILDINKYFNFKQIYPGCKVTHFKKLKEQSKIEYDEMVFFDDEHRNIQDITEIGVVCQHVSRNGVSINEVIKCIKNFKEKLKSDFS